MQRRRQVNDDDFWDAVAEAERVVTDPTTGGRKGKKPEEYALIPVGALAEIAKVYGFGARKYEPNNWRKGYAWSLSYSAMQRHLNAFWGGEETDPESKLPHLAHAAFHMMSLLTWSSDDKYKSLDDR
jgi:hypothetical protein